MSTARFLLVLLGLGLEVGDVDVAVAVARDDHDLHAGHRGARRIGAVGGSRDETDVAVSVAAALVVLRITSKPAYSPCEPALGCKDTPANR